MIVCLGWIPYNKKHSFGQQGQIEEHDVELNDLPEGVTGVYDVNSGFYYTTDDEDENYPFK